MNNKRIEIQSDNLHSTHRSLKHKTQDHCMSNHYSDFGAVKGAPLDASGMKSSMQIGPPG